MSSDNEKAVPRSKVDVNDPRIVGKVSRSLSKAEGRPYLRIYVKQVSQDGAVSFVHLGNASAVSADQDYAFIRAPKPSA